jgi:uncharacterized protein with HEPN domain
MSLRDLKGYLWDVLEACKKVQTYTKEKTFDDYQADDLLRSAVERQLTIAGEALAQASQHFPEVATMISQLRQIVGFRNRMIHAYLQIDDLTVWGVVEKYVPLLKHEAQVALDKLREDEPLG